MKIAFNSLSIKEKKMSIQKTQKFLTSKDFLERYLQFLEISAHILLCSFLYKVSCTNYGSFQTFSPTS